MNHKIAVIIPSTVNVNQTASTEIVTKWVKSAKEQFAELFGGFTSHSAVGGWMSAQGLVEEAVTVVASFTDDAGLKRLGEVKVFAARMAKDMSQEVVSLEVDNHLHFIHPLAVAA